MGEHPFDLARGGHPEVSGFGVQGAAVDAIPGALLIAQEGLADVAECDLLEVLERFDGRVFTGPGPRPGAQQGSQRGHVGMDINHIARVRVGGQNL